jgi:tetratricopeptide (TPR) repeat protein
MSSPVVDGGALVGRSTALDEFDRFREAGGGAGLFAVWGEPGIGKSYLLRRLRHRHGDDRSALVDLDALGSTGDYTDLVRTLLDAIAAAFACWDQQAARDYFDLSQEAAAAETSLLAQQPTVQVSQRAVLRNISQSPITVSMPSPRGTVSALRQNYHPRLLRALVELVRRCRPEEKLLLLDSFEQARSLAEESVPLPDDVRQAVDDRASWATRSLLPALLSAAGLRIVVAGWADVTTALPAHRVRLTEWSVDETAEYLSTREIRDPALGHAIHGACKGHPAWTALVADTVATSRAGGRQLTAAEIETAARRESFDRWLIPMFLGRLPARQRPIVMAAAVLREFTAEAVQSLFVDKDDRDILYPGWANDLFSFSFVRRLPISAAETDGTRRLHPLIRTAILQHHREINPEDARRLHRRAADHCRRRGLVYEEHYHRFAGGDLSISGRWLDELIVSERRHQVSKTRALVDGALAPECVARLAELDPNVLFEAYYAAIRVYFVDRVRRSQFVEAGYALAVRLDSALEIANFGSQRATLAIQDGNLDVAEGLLSAALDTYQSLNNAVGIGNALTDLGWILEERGEFDRARERYAQMRDVALSTANWHQAARAFVLASATWKGQGEATAARNVLLAAAESLSAKSGSYAAVMSVQSALASLAEELGDGESQRRHLALALEAASAAGDVHSEATLTLELAIACVRAQDWRSAAQYGQRALSIARELGHLPYLKRALHHVTEANLHLDLSAAEAFADELDDLVRFDTVAEICDGVLLRLRLAREQEAAGLKNQWLTNVLIAGERSAAKPGGRDHGGGSEGDDDLVRHTRQVASAEVQRIGHVLLSDGAPQALIMTGRILAALNAASESVSGLAHGYLFAGVGCASNPDKDDTSLAWLAQALDLFGPDGDIGCRGTAHSAQGEIHARAGRYAQAKGCFMAARELWSVEGYTPGVEGMTARLAQLPAVGEHERADEHDGRNLGR